MNDTCRYLIYIASTSWSIRESMPINLSISPDNKTYKNTFDLDYYDDLDLVVDECLFQNRWPRLSLHTEGQINTYYALQTCMGVEKRIFLKLIHFHFMAILAPP